MSTRRESPTERVRAALDAVNARHPWSHNEYHHGWILRSLPRSRGAVLDVGCGDGTLAVRLAQRFRRVVALDADPGMAEVATRRLAAHPGARVRLGRFEEYVAVPPGERPEGMPPAGFDAVVMVASLHHLDPEATLRAIPRLLAPGGRLLVVGLVRSSWPADLPLDLVSALLDPVVGLVVHPRPVRPAPPGAAAAGPVMPVRDPRLTAVELRRTARELLPGSVLRRRLFYRHTLFWQAPGLPPSGPGAGDTGDRGVPGPGV